MQPRSLIVLTLPLFSLWACGGDTAPAPADVRARISGDLGHVLRESASAGERGSAALQAQTALGFIGRFTATSQTAVLGKTSLGALNLGALANGAQLQRADGAEPGSELDTDQLIEELNDKIFTDANHLGDGVYRIPGELFCADDAECVQQFDKLQARLRVEEDNDALIIALQLDSNHDEPLRLALTHDSLAVTIDLDETGQAVAALAPVFGEGAPNAALAGAVTGKIEVLGPQSATFSLAVDRKIDIKFADAGISLDSADAFRFASAAAQVASLSFDGVAGSGSLVVDIGATTAHVPSFEDPAATNDPTGIDVDLPGASVVAMLASGQPAQLTHISLGDRTTTVSVGGQRAIAIDLNPDDGRALSATLSHDDASGTDTIAVSPKLDLRTTVDHAVLGDSAPVYDVTQVLMTGSLRGGASDQIEVVSGTFAIATNPAEFGFSASTGQCVSSVEAEDATTGNFYEQFTVGACN